MSRRRRLGRSWHLSWCLVKVEIWSDVVCPWCYIGKRRFEEALDRLADKGISEPIEIRYRSYQLDPKAPTSPGTPVVDAYAKKFGGRDRAEQILQHLTGVAAQEGLTFRFDIATRANTIMAHRALHWAWATHGAFAQSRMKEALLAAYFTHGRDISSLDVIVDLCTEQGLESQDLRSWLEAGGGIEDVEADIKEAAARDITAVPSYVINDQFLVPGAQDAALFEQVITKILTR